MKLLLDQNLSRRLVPVLEQCFPGTTQVALINMDKASDEEIWCYAKQNDFCIVTKDSDFEEFSLIKGSPPKVIWIKLGNTCNQELLHALINNKAYIEETLGRDEITCLEIFN